MKSKFSNHFGNDELRRKKLWDECFFVFDTNVYTGVYKRSDDARDAFYKIVESLGERLWAPYQVIYEYLDNRAKITHDQSKLYADAITELRGILSGFASLTKHPFLSAGTHSEFFAVSERALGELEEKRVFHDDRINNDDIKEKLAVLLEGKVGDKYTVERLRELIKEGEVRYANLDAPGFQDVGKYKGSSVFDQVCKRYGDLIIWKQIIDRAKEIGKPVILVTEEQKEDWWEKAGGRTIGPLPELLEEFELECGQDFYLYSYHGFLQLANNYLNQDTSAAVIDEVRDSAPESSVDLFSEFGVDEFAVVVDDESDPTMSIFGGSVPMWTEADKAGWKELQHASTVRAALLGEAAQLDEQCKRDAIKIKKLISDSSNSALVSVFKTRNKGNLARLHELKKALAHLDLDISVLKADF